MGDTLHIDQLRTTLGPEATERFLRHARVVPDSEVTELGARVAAHRDRAHVEAAQNARLDLRLAEKLAGACVALLAEWPRLAPPERALAVGAVRYYIDQHDADDDFGSSVGFEDDRRVLAFVLSRVLPDHPAV